MAADGRSLLEKLRRVARALRWPAMVLVLAALVANLAIGPVARALVERALEEALECPVSIYQVKPKPLAGSARLRQVTVDNPPGCPPGELLILPRVQVEFPSQTPFGRRIEIDSLRISDPTVLLDLRESGVNFFLLLDRIRERVARLEALEGSPGRPEPYRFKVREVRLERLRFVLRGSAETAEVQPLARVASLTLNLDGWHRLEGLLARILGRVANAFDNHTDRDSLPPELISELGPESAPFPANTAGLPMLGTTSTRSR